MKNVQIVPCQHDASYKINPNGNLPYNTEVLIEIFRNLEPDRRPFPCWDEVEQKAEMISIQNCQACFEYILKQLAFAPETVVELFTPTISWAGGWPAPQGCVHYLKHVFPTIEAAIDWLRYCYDHDSDPYNLNVDGKTLREYLAEIELLVKEEYERIEAKPNAISMHGGWYCLFDGCYHYCSIECALLAWGFVENVTPEQEIELKIARAL